MARLSLRRASVLPGVSAILLALALSACGRPQPPEPPAALAGGAEAPPELLGGPPVEFAEAEAPQPPSVLALEARRPGWGTMAPIPNPPEGARHARASLADERELGPAPYRLIGPTLPPRYASKAGPTLRTDAGSGVARGMRIVPEPGAGQSGRKGRVRHWIVPASRGR